MFDDNKAKSDYRGPPAHISRTGDATTIEPGGVVMGMFSGDGGDSGCANDVLHMVTLRISVGVAYVAQVPHTSLFKHPIQDEGYCCPALL